MSDVRLLGRWQADVSDHRTLQDLGEARMEFFDGGRLLYSVRQGEKLVAMKLVWRTEADVLIIDQPSHPREDRGKYWIDEAGRLWMTNEQGPACFVRL